MIVFCFCHQSPNAFSCPQDDDPCGDFQPFYEMALKGHVFQTLKVPSSLYCLEACKHEARCQSFNHVMGKDTCELNNRTKEARPEDFISDVTKLYLKKPKNRVALGSIPELPAVSCEEIKMSEGQVVASKKYWMICINQDMAVLAYCNMTTGVPLINFTTKGYTGRYGIIQRFIVPKSGVYLIKAWGARGGTHSTNYGDYPGTYYGGRGAMKQGTFCLNVETVLNIVVGQRGGDSVEVKGGQSTNLTAAQLELSVEDNAGTGGGGGSFVYTTNNELLLAAGGGGGASNGYNGVDGQAGPNGTSSVGNDSSAIYGGGTGGQPGQCNNNPETADYHGGVGAGWLGEGCARVGPEHGERGGSRIQNWVGGRAGGMNSGYNGGPPPGAVGGFGGGGGGSEDNGASGGGGGYSGGGSGLWDSQAGGGGGSYCSGSSCLGVTGGNMNDHGFVEVFEL
ncbi:hypothetical protein ABFA07_017308 [Porites harrisoni]